MNLDAIFARLQARPALRQRLDMADILGFIALTTRVCRDIDLAQPIHISAEPGPPLILPPTIVDFLAAGLNLSTEEVEECWAVLKEVVWDAPGPEQSVRLAETVFEVHGHASGIGMCLSAVTHVCILTPNLKHPVHSIPQLPHAPRRCARIASR